MKTVLGLLLVLALYSNGYSQTQLTLQQELAAWHNMSNSSNARSTFRSTTGRYQGSAVKSGNVTTFRDTKGMVQMRITPYGNILVFRSQTGQKLGTITNTKKK